MLSHHLGFTKGTQSRLSEGSPRGLRLKLTLGSNSDLLVSIHILCLPSSDVFCYLGRILLPSKRLRQDVAAELVPPSVSAEFSAVLDEAVFATSIPYYAG